MRRIAPLLSLFLTACGGPNAEESDPEPIKLQPSVLRDCPAEPGVICPWAGVGLNGFNGDQVHRLDAWFSFPMSVNFQREGPPIIADWNNHKLRAVRDNPEDGFETIQGTDFLGDGDPMLLDQTEEGAPGTTVNLNHPTQHAYFPPHCPADLAGKLLSASWHTHKLRIQDLETGRVRVWVGAAAGFSGVDFDEPADTALFNQPRQVLIDAACDVYIVDMRNERIRKLNIDTWTLDTIAGNGDKGYSGDGGPALEAALNFPKNGNPEPGGYIAFNEDETLLYVADTENHAIRVLDLTTGTIDLLAGTPEVAGFADGPALEARFDFPTGLAIDHGTGELFVADANNHRVRVIDLATGEVSTFAGNGEPSCPPDPAVVIPVCDNQHDAGDGGLATEATLYRPFGVDLDLDGNLVIADTYNHRFRIVYR